MLINSMAGGGSESPEAVALAVSSLSLASASTSEAYNASVGTDATFGNALVQYTGNAVPDHFWLVGCIGNANWGYLLIGPVDLFDHELEATFVTPEGSAYGSGKHIRVKIYIQDNTWTSNKGTTYHDLYLHMQVLETDANSSGVAVKQLQYDRSFFTTNPLAE